ncbi:hypothetical protein OAP32_00435 [Crocinitomicaceae bacterium]|nr:hypothetical protein [Crocinitomicaceae bacterium]
MKPTKHRSDVLLSPCLVLVHCGFIICLISRDCELILALSEVLTVIWDNGEVYSLTSLRELVREYFHWI